MVFLTLVIALTGVVGIILVIQGGEDTKRIIKASEDQACAAQKIAEASQRNAKAAEDFSASATHINEGVGQAVEKLEGQATNTHTLAVQAIGQGAITKGQLEVMREDERVWLEFSLVTDPNDPKKITISYTVGQPTSVPVQVANTGKSAALNVDVLIFSGIFDAASEVPLNFVDDPDHHSHNNISTGIIFPSKNMEFRAVRTKNGDFDPVTIQEVQALQSRDSYFAIFGRITYCDVFKRSHSTDFCAWQANENGPVRSYETRSCVSFNGVDREQKQKQCPN